MSWGPADDVWNRACAEAGRPKELVAPGDRALADMVLAHSLAMNGGVLHAVECLDPAELIGAVAGYRYFGLVDAAQVIEDTAIAWNDGEHDADAAERLELDAEARYALVVEDDQVLVDAFKARYAREPTAFAPIEVR